jgi:hypothetical protein
MRVEHTLSYDAAPAQVCEMLLDPAFREKVAAHQHATGAKVAVDRSGDHPVVAVDSSRPADGIPSFAKKFVGDTIHILQQESWRTTDTADLHVTIPGKPGELHGSVSLTSSGAGTTQTIAGELKVSIPLLGAKIERLIDDLLGKALRVEERVGRAWLAGDR